MTATENTLVWTDTTHMLKCLQFVADVVAHDDLRPALKGIQLQHNGDYFEVTATDGFRLHTARFHGAGEPFQCVVNPASVLAILKGAPKHGFSRIVARGDIVLVNGHAVETLPLNFPRWQQIVPLRRDHTISLDLRQIETALSVAVLVESHVILTTNAATLTVESPADRGGNRDALTFRTNVVTPESGTWSWSSPFNAAFIRNVVRGLKRLQPGILYPAACFLDMNDADAKYGYCGPVVFRADVNGTEFRAVVMPMHIPA